MKKLTLLLTIALVSSCFAIDMGPGGHVYMTALDKSSGAYMMKLKSLTIAPDWTFSVADNGTINANGIPTTVDSSHDYESLSWATISPEILTANDKGYADLVMVGYWANGSEAGLPDRAANNATYPNDPTAGFLKVTPTATSRDLTVLGTGLTSIRDASIQKGTDGSLLLVDPGSAAGTGSFGGMSGLTLIGDNHNGGYGLNYALWHENTGNTNITDKADMSYQTSIGAGAAKYDTRGDAEIIGANMYMSYRYGASTRYILKITNGVATANWWAGTTGNLLFNSSYSNTPTLCNGLAAGSVTGSDNVVRDAVWVITNDGTTTGNFKQQITELVDLNDNGVIDNDGLEAKIIVTKADLLDLAGLAQSQTMRDMELITDANTGKQFLLVDATGDNKLLVFALNADGTFTSSASNLQVLDLGAGGLSGTSYSFAAMEFDVAPEPATMALLGMGGIFGLLRRRRA